MNNYIKLITALVLTLFIISCSGGGEQPAQEDTGKEIADTEEVKHTERPPFDFRKTRWGMSREEVMKAEVDGPQFETENSVEYVRFIGDLHAQTNYKFQDDKLIRGGYYFPTEYEDKNEYIETYEHLKERMIKAKGSPVIDRVVQLDPSVEIDPEKKGQAVCDGKLIYGTQWNYPGSDIQLVFRGDGTNCYLTITFLKSLPDEPEDEKASAE